MKRYLSVMFILFLGTSAVNAQLKIDFTPTNGSVESGYQGYFSDHEVASTFTAQSFSAFGTTITIKPSWATGAVNTAMQMIDRGNGTTDGLVDLLRDWIGTDTRSAGNPMTLTISGLPAGTYSWLSYHHDRDAQTMGQFDVTVNDATGSTTTTDIQITGSAVTAADQVATFKTTIVSNGKDDVSLVFDMHPFTNQYNEAWFLMNGFEMDFLSTINGATGPRPAEGETDVALDTNLTWTPGLYEGTHDVYFGTNYNDVNDASRSNPLGVLVSQGQSDTSYTPADLEPGTTYYWRVDEVNSTPDHTIYPGSVWSFTAEPVAFPLDSNNITATASSQSPGRDVNNIINGSGLNASDQHSTHDSDMWISSATGPQPTWVQFSFDQLYALHDMKVWNANTVMETVLGLGVKDVNIATSLDGIHWTVYEANAVFNQGTGFADYAANTVIDFNDTKAQYVKLMIQSNWGGLVPQYSLSEVRFSYLPTYAHRPKPTDGTTLSDLNGLLQWRSGRQAAQHEVYLGTDANLVAAGDVSVLAGTVNTHSLDVTDQIQYAQTYYWQVTEINDAASQPRWVGPMWSFTTPPYFTVDDMESYSNDDNNRIFNTWVDGYDDSSANGALVGANPLANDYSPETTVVNSGSQSLPIWYDNTSAPVSEATRTFAAPQNWAAGGLKTLVLYFFGDRDSTGGTLFVDVDGAEVDSSSSLSLGLWKQMSVDLGSLGIDLSHVQKLTIGVKGAGSGTLYIDEIRIYREAPAVVTPSDPGNASLVLDYEMDGSLADSSGQGLDGTLQGTPLYVDSLNTEMGQALSFDGIENYVDVPVSNLLTQLTDSTFSAWVNIDPGSTGSWQRVFDFGTDTTNYLFLCPRTGTTGPVRAAIINPTIGYETGVTSGAELTDGWHHVACVFDANTLTLYVDGWSAGSVPTPITPKDLVATTQDWLGQSQWSGDSLLMGLLDQFRIYNRALNPDEIRYLAGDR